MSLVSIKSSLTANAISKLKVDKDGKPVEKYAKLPNVDIGPCEVLYEVPDTLEGIAKVFTDKVAFNLFVGHIKFSIEGRVRKLLAEAIAAGKTLEQAQKEIQNHFYNLQSKEYKWKPDDRPARMSPAEKEARRIAKLPKDQQKAEIDALRKRLAALEKEA